MEWEAEPDAEPDFALVTMNPGSPPPVDAVVEWAEEAADAAQASDAA